MKYTTATVIAALGFSSQAVAETSEWGTWTSSSSKTTPVIATQTSGWDWDPSTSSYGTWDPWTSSSTPKSAIPSSSYGSWSVWDPTKSTWVYSSTVQAAATTSTWAAWTTSPAKSATTPVIATYGVCCKSYALGGDSWGFPSCADPVSSSTWADWSSSDPTTTKQAVGTSTWADWSSSDPTTTKQAVGTANTTWADWAYTTPSAVSTIATGVLPTTWLEPSKSWAINIPTGSSSPSYTDGNDGWTDNTCNDGSSRDKWCYGLDINTDHSTTWPNTGNVCEFDFTITNTTVNYDGDDRMALAVNGQVPGPAIICNWGDTVKITVHNQMQNNGTTIHWHGIRQIGTNPNDGVPGVTECALAPGDSRVYQWVATSHGSSWYHSHYNTQWGDGVHGPIIIKGPTTANYDVDMGSVMIDDLFNVTATQEYYTISHTGPQNAANYLLNGKNTKPDLSAGEHQLWNVEAGKKYLFRLVNSASQNSWVVGIDNHTFTVIAADFTPITPYTTTSLNIGNGQRYDVVVEADQAVDSYWFRVATQGACPGATDNTGFGLANGIIKYSGASDSYPTSGPNFSPAQVGPICADEPLASLVPYISKNAGDAGQFAASSSVLPAGQVNTVNYTDDGTVFRWYLNGNTLTIDPANPTLKTLAQGGTFTPSDNVVTLNNAETWVYFVIQNEFFASHPFHLHGHDFALLGQGVGNFSSALVSSLDFTNPIRRDTAMLEGSGYTVIGFVTDNPGAWIMHCHIAWHADGGLAMQFIERPNDIPATSWAGASSFTDQCSNWATYDATAVYHQTGGESGLKRRESFDFVPDVVRRSGSEKAARRYVKENIKRGLGDGQRRHALF